MIRDDVTGLRRMDREGEHRHHVEHWTNSLGLNHVEYWKTFIREKLDWGGESSSSYTVGFPWFATWPASRRLRWPIGRPGASPLPWMSTSDQCRHELTEETQNVHRIRHGYEEVHEKDTKRARWVPVIRYRRGAVATALMLSRATLTSGNPPRGWDKNGEQIQ